MATLSAKAQMEKVKVDGAKAGADQNFQEQKLQADDSYRNAVAAAKDKFEYSKLDVARQKGEYERGTRAVATWGRYCRNGVSHARWVWPGARKPGGR